MDDGGVLHHFPLPIARGYRRYLNASEVRERHDAAYYLFEIYLKYTASIAIALYLRGQGRDHRVNAALKGLARPSLGEWLRFLRECIGFVTRDGQTDPLAGSLAGLLSARDGRQAELVRLHNSLRSFRTGGPSQKSEVSLEALLGEIVAYRNRVIGHGAPLDSAHYRGFSGLLAAAFSEILEASPFLTACRLAYIDVVRVEEGARVECSLIEFMGDQPIRRQVPHTIPYGEAAPRARSLYLLLPGGGLLPLDPLLLAHSEDIFFLNEAAAPLGGAEMGVSASPEYLSYATGDRHRPIQLTGSQGELFERILGYAVGEHRISRFGDDVVHEKQAPSDGGRAEAETRLGDFRILREVGRGAMGTVFEAVQESLGRRVALKVLPGSFALEPRRLERFRREARATSRIHHASIVPVYEVGETAGTHYYAMEFVDGPSLDKLLDAARKAPPGSSARKGSSASDPAQITAAVEQIAALSEGLHEAHCLGLIHRDVKPSNILVDSSGRHVLVDFGLVHEEEAGTLTRSGELVGTLCYMSPEQLSRRRVDARSDVYSLGATLYEVLTLRPPFLGESEHQVQNGILFEEPVPPRRLNPRVSRDLETIILHALEKNPERRYASAAELAEDLRRCVRHEPIRARPIPALGRLVRRARRHRTALVAGAVILVLLALLGWVTQKTGREERARLLASHDARAVEALAVLPFENVGGDPGTEYLSDGVADQIINSLSQVRRQGLKVRPLTSVSRYKRQKADVPTMGRDLNVEMIVTGTLRQEGDELWISVALVDAREDVHLWGQRYQGKLGQILDVQDQIARDLAANLRLRLTGEEEERVTRRYTKDPEAYLLFREGVHHWNKYTEDALETAIEYFERALKKDPNYTIALVGMARSYILLGTLYRGPRETHPHARGLLFKALEIDDSLADAHAGLGVVYLYHDWDWPAAEREVQRAIAGTGWMIPHNIYGFWLAAHDRLPEALASIQRGQELDPLAAPRRNELAHCHNWMRQYDQAIAEAKKALDLDPNFPLARGELAEALTQKGLYEEAIAELEKAPNASKEHPRILGQLGCAYVMAGQKEKSREVLERLKGPARHSFGRAFGIARIHAALGEKDQAFEWLQKARDERDPMVIWLKVDPMLDNLRPDSRFGQALKEMGLPP